jgi:hypothetical protein
MKKLKENTQTQGDLISLPTKVREGVKAEGQTDSKLMS